MRALFVSIALAGLLALAGCGIGCSELPASFTSYPEAIEKIRSASFKIEETQDTDRSSWVKGAEFYCCDGASGFFILHTHDQEYIHAGVPLSVWEGFKEATSFGSYYTANIRGRYRLDLK